MSLCTWFCSSFRALGELSWRSQMETKRRLSHLTCPCLFCRQPPSLPIPPFLAPFLRHDPYGLLYDEYLLGRFSYFVLGPKACQEMNRVIRRFDLSSLSLFSVSTRTKSITHSQLIEFCAGRKRFSRSKASLQYLLQGHIIRFIQ